MRLLGILLLCAWIFTPYRVSAQSSDPGTSFWFGFMSNESLAPEDVLVVTISASLATSGVIEIPGQGWSQSFYIQAQSSIDIEIPGDLAEVNSEQTIESRAIHIQSALPVSVQALSYSPAKTDATRILSDDLLGTRYIGAGYPGLTDFSSQLLIVSSQDDTEIEIVPTVTTSNGNLAGIPFSIQLNQGECYRMIASGTGDLTGTQVTATATSGNCRPFAVFGGCVNARVPQTCLTAVDYLFEQLYDVSRWGTNYLVAPFGFDINSSFSNLVAPTYTYRILASENSTAISIDGAASTLIQAGDFIEFNAQEDAHCISSNKPIAVLQYMEGISCAGNGDPAMLWVQPLDVSVEEAFFSASDFPDLNTHFINMVIPAAALGTCKLDGVLIPVAQFSQAGACGDYWYCTREVNPGQHRLECPMGFSGSLYSVNDEMDNPAGIALTLSNGVAAQPVMLFEQTTCSNSAAELNVPPNYTSPEWYYAEGDNTLLSNSTPFTIAVPIENAVYELQALSTLSGCVDTFYYSVESPDAIPVSIVQHPFNVCSFETVVLTAQTPEPNAVYQYAWSPNAEYFNGNESQIVVTAEDEMGYSVTLTTPSGCAIGTASITVDVEQGDIARFEVVEDYYRICTGETVSLEVEVEDVVWRDNFDPAISWGDWESISGGDESNVCGVVSGNALYFNGAFPREAITQPLDLSGGATAFFAIKIANGTAPCDDAEPGDHVVLSYSVGGGAWTTVQTFYESAYPDFTVVSVSMPQAACNPNTRLRWRQNGSYTNNQDNWVLDNAYISHNVTSTVACSWSPSAGLMTTMGASVDAMPAATTWYEVTTIDPATGCDYMDSVWVEVGQPFTLATPNMVVCSPQQVMLSATPSVAGIYEYMWTPAAGMLGSFTANPTVDISVDQTFIVEATSEFGCTAEATLEVELGSLFNLAITMSEDSLCQGESATLTAALSAQVTGVDFLWTGDASIITPTSNIIQVTPVADAQFTCVATQASSGCSAAATVTVDVTPEFGLSITPSTIQTCMGEGTPVSASATIDEPMQWVWSPQEWVLDAGDPSTELTTNNSGTMTIMAITAAGCTGSASLPIEVQPLITDLGEDAGQCIDESYTISVDWPADYSIVWNTGETSASIVVSNTGTYSVSVQAPDGCVSTDEIEVEFFDYPQLELGEDTSACAGAEIRLQAGQPGLEYLWNTGQLSREIYVTESGVYSVEITNGYCLSRDTVELVFHPLPVQPFEPEYEYCFEASTESFYLDAENQGATYVWNNDSTSRILLIQQPGTFGVRVRSEFGCENEFQTTVSRACIEALYIPNSFTPDGDGVNDEWLVYGTNIVNYHLQIFNSWGELFYESFDMEIPWTGEKGDGAHYVDTQAYAYIIRYQLVQDNGLLSTERSMKGFVTLIR